ncbi:Transcriptional activator somA-like protein [Elsinoe fawcettii]|nr:Transcriptional activator somA-like protein [Elsinoe fawcettii]
MDKTESASPPPPPIGTVYQMQPTTPPAPQRMSNLDIPTAPPPNTRDFENGCLQDYQMQLMLLEQQNKRRLLQSKQENEARNRQPPGNYTTTFKTRDPLTGLSDDMSKLGVGGSKKPEVKTEFTQTLPSLPVPGQKSDGINPNFDLPADGSAGRKWPTINTASIHWGPR